MSSRTFTNVDQEGERPRGRGWTPRRAIVLGLAALALPLAIGGGIVGAADETVETRTVALDGATRSAVELDMDFGDLTVRGGAAGSGNLMDAEFAFDDGDWRPTVEYGVTGETGELKVGQPGDGDDLDFGDLDDLFQNEGNDWTVALSPDVPLDLAVDLDTGVAELDLAGLNLSGLDINMEAGELVVDLSGVAPARDLDATISVEAGEVDLIVPDNVGVRIDVDNDVGDIDADGFERDGDAYVNGAYGEAPVTIRIDLDANVGEVDLSVAPADAAPAA